ncbi:MAG: hypothetical protein K6E49_08550 [Lachnospiraceae bacterium]|nr:hypothetical protein [Lachnospiraceae bacterium]
MRLKSFIAELNIIQRAICVAASIALFVIAVLSVMSVRGAGTYDVDFSAVNEFSDEDGTGHIEFRGISLRKGYYTISVGYGSKGPASIEIVLDNETRRVEELPEAPSADGLNSYGFELGSGTDEGRIDFTYPEGSDLKLAFINISSERPLYYDGLIIGAVLILLIPCVWLLMYRYKRTPRKLSFVIALAVAAITMLPFLVKSSLPLGIDTRAHMMRVEGIFYGLLDGQFPVVIYPEWNNSYGQVGVLYPNLFLYIPAFFRLLGMSQLGTFKLFMFVIITASVFIAYKSFKCIFDSDWQIAVVLSVVSLDIMRLYNMYGDGRFGGALLAEMFYPLVVAGLIEVFFRQNGRWYLLAYGIAGIFCTHVVTSSLVCISVVVFVVCSAGRLANRNVLASIGKALLLFAGLAIGTMLPFFKFYFTDWGKGDLQWENFIATLWPRGAFYDDKKWIPVFILFAACIIALIAIAAGSGFDKVRKTYIIPALVSGGVMLWMSTAAFPWNVLDNIGVIGYYSNMLQDSYRFVSLSACFFAFCLPALADNVRCIYDIRRPGRSRAVIITAALTAVICTASYAITAYEFLYQMAYTLYYDKVMGEVEYQMEDYLPAGTQSEWYESDSGYISDEEAVSSIDYKRDGTEIFYSYTNSAKGAYAEFPRFYYNGYIAVDENGERIDIEKGDKNRIRVYLKQTDTPASVKLWYHVTWDMMFAAALSFGLWFGSVAMVVYREVFLDKRKGFLYNFKCSAKEREGS